MRKELEENKRTLIAVTAVIFVGVALTATQTGILESEKGKDDRGEAMEAGDAMQPQGDAMRAQDDTMNSTEDSMDNKNGSMEQ
jgi:hypothetical protein